MNRHSIWSTTPRRVALTGSLVVMVVGGYAYRWIADDAMIDFRIVDNLLHGHGPVYNVGQRVEVYTNPLWVALLALARVLFFFLPLGTIAVLLGLVLSASAVTLAWRAFGSSVSEPRRNVIPVGLVLFCCLPATWEFVTSGLETSLSFFWIGLSASRVRKQPRSITTALIIGCAPLVRPDLVIVAFFLGLYLLADVRREQSRRSLVRAVALLVAPTFIYEIFRVAYFGILVSNTALVKSATSPRLDVGWNYLLDFLQPYFLLVPILGLVLWVVLGRGGSDDGHKWYRDIRWPLFLGGAINAAYIVFVGGDFMHARLLLPSFFAMMAACTLRPPRRGRPLLYAVGATYLVVLVVGLRYPAPRFEGYVMVSDERVMQISLTHRAHPVNETDMVDSIWWQYGARLRTIAESHSGPHSDFVVGSSPTVLTGAVNFKLQVVPTSAKLATPVVAASRTLGQVGLAAGPQVTIFDVLSLANPVSSHFALTERTLRPGHEKEAALSWYLAQYGSSHSVGLMNYYSGFFHYPLMTGRDVRSARQALHCGQLRWYLQSLNSPLSLHQIVSNVRHAAAWTALSYSAEPSEARHELCPTRR